MAIADICFNDPMGIGDYIYNLRLVRDFLATNVVPPSPCHFELEEFMYASFRLWEGLTSGRKAHLTARETSGCGVKL